MLINIKLLIIVYNLLSILLPQSAKDWNCAFVYPPIAALISPAATVVALRSVTKAGQYSGTGKKHEH